MSGHRVFRNAVIALSVVGAVAAAATIAQAELSARGVARNGPWIAYSTTPAGDIDCIRSCPKRPGGDVFVTRVGGRPKLVAGRGSVGEIWNVCPAFSPNGRLLAFARFALNAADRWTIVVVRVAPRGPLRAGKVVLKVPGGKARCPRWSADSSRLAYVRRGKVVIRGLDGSRLQRANGDPTLHDFDTRRTEIVSPTGELVAKHGFNTIVVSRPDGSTWSVIPDDEGGYGSYAIGGWSPDGRELLLMKDIGCGFQMRAVSVDPPFVSETVVVCGRVNGARSWPGYGDVSWQPLPRRTTDLPSGG